jgi:hypothetical protein
MITTRQDITEKSLSQSQGKGGRMTSKALWEIGMLFSISTDDKSQKERSACVSYNQL